MKLSFPSHLASCRRCAEFEHDVKCARNKPHARLHTYIPGWAGVDDFIKYDAWGKSGVYKDWPTSYDVVHPTP